MKRDKECVVARNDKAFIGELENEIARDVGIEGSSGVLVEMDVESRNDAIGERIIGDGRLTDLGERGWVGGVKCLVLGSESRKLGRALKCQNSSLPLADMFDGGLLENDCPRECCSQIAAIFLGFGDRFETWAYQFLMIFFPCLRTGWKLSSHLVLHVVDGIVRATVMYLRLKVCHVEFEDRTYNWTACQHCRQSTVC